MGKSGTLARSYSFFSQRRIKTGMASFPGQVFQKWATRLNGFVEFVTVVQD
jgi:hypothetical protein